MSHEQFASLFEKGVAVGETHISTDTMSFRFRDEVFTFPTMQVYQFARNSGYGFYTIPVDKLRELERESAGATR